MKTFLLVLLIVLAIIFIGGALKIGGDSIFGHVDSALGRPLLTNVYYTVFFFMRSGAETVESGYTSTDQGLKDFQEKPLGFDKKKKYRDLDKAATY